MCVCGGGGRLVSVCSGRSETVWERIARVEHVGRAVTKQCIKVYTASSFTRIVKLSLLPPGGGRGFFLA